MGKKSLVFCDLCKKDVAESELKQLNLANQYEVCTACFDDLETRCSSEHKVQATRQESKPTKIENFDSDEDFVATKRSEVEVIAEQEEAVAKPRFAEQAYTSSGECRHLNKGRVTMGNINSSGQSKRGFFRRCLDCGVAIQEATKEEKSTYLNSRPVGDIRENRHGN